MWRGEQLFFGKVPVGSATIHTIIKGKKEEATLTHRAEIALMVKPQPDKELPKFRILRTEFETESEKRELEREVCFVICLADEERSLIEAAEKAGAKIITENDSR